MTLIRSASGSSPLVRGQRAVCVRWVRRAADHPRSCGANLVNVKPPRKHDGSSPLVRGQRSGVPVIGAGGLDHPRSCGANSLSALSGPALCGSSPLVRGQLVLGIIQQFDGRIIPARAGPTSGSMKTPRRRTDHPRSCGANSRWGKQASLETGSSPLVRGQLPSLPPPPVRLRIIPARAGPTTW